MSRRKGKEKARPKSADFTEAETNALVSIVYDLFKESGESELITGRVNWDAVTDKMNGVFKHKRTTDNIRSRFGILKGQFNLFKELRSRRKWTWDAIHSKIVAPNDEAWKALIESNRVKWRPLKNGKRFPWYDAFALMMGSSVVSGECTLPPKPYPFSPLSSREANMAGLLGAKSAETETTMKTEILEPAMLFPPQPIRDGLESNGQVGPTISQFQSAVPDSGCEKLDLPPSPPPLPMISGSPEPDALDVLSFKTGPPLKKSRVMVQSEVDTGTFVSGTAETAPPPGFATIDSNRSKKNSNLGHSFRVPQVPLCSDPMEEDEVEEQAPEELGGSEHFRFHTEDQRLRYEQYISVRKFSPTFTLCEPTIIGLDIYHSVQTMFERVGLWEFVCMEHRGYKELTHEFMSSLTVNRSGVMTFQLRDRPYSVNTSMFCEICGIPTIGVESPPAHFSRSDYYGVLTGIMGMRRSIGFLASHVWNLAIRYVHQIIANIVIPRGETTRLILKEDTYVLAAMLEPETYRSPALGRTIIEKLESLSRNGVYMKGGHFAVLLANYFGITIPRGYTGEDYVPHDVDHLVLQRSLGRIPEVDSKYMLMWKGTNFPLRIPNRERTDILRRENWLPQGDVPEVEHGDDDAGEEPEQGHVPVQLLNTGDAGDTDEKVYGAPHPPQPRAPQPPPRTQQQQIDYLVDWTKEQDARFERWEEETQDFRNTIYHKYEELASAQRRYDEMQQYMLDLHRSYYEYQGFKVPPPPHPPHQPPQPPQ